jgi:hypothetical protein
MSLLAQFDVPSEGLSSSYYRPLILLGLLYVALFVTSRVLAGRGDQRFETAADGAFVTTLLAGVYVLILTLVALFSEPELVYDMIRIALIVMAFFALFLLVLLLIFDVGIGSISRLRHRGDR